MSPKQVVYAPLSPLPYQSRIDLVDDNREVFVHMPVRTGAMEPHSSPLNLCKDLKHLTPNIMPLREIITSQTPGDDINLYRSSIDYVYTGELDEYQSTEVKLEEVASESARAPYLRGLINPSLNYKPEQRHWDFPRLHCPSE